MKRQLSLLVSFLFITCLLTGQENQSVPSNARMAGICFTENKGQVHDQFFRPRKDIWYGAKSGNLAIHIRNSGVSYQLYKTERLKKNYEGKMVVAQQRIYRIDINWLNPSADIYKTEEDTLPGYSNYYLESCPNGALRAKSYKSVTLHNLYRGIDLHYYEKNGALKHDYIVAPNADYKQIRLQVNGAKIRLNADGTLLLSTPLGEVQEGAPVVFQEGQQLKARWQVEGQVLSFVVENYNSDLPLVIDPVTRLWSTYYGDSADQGFYDCTTDLYNNVYGCGWTYTGSSTLIATVGSHQTTHAGGYTDGMVVKFDGNGNRLWATFYGGSGDDTGGSCATDPNGNVFFAGHTMSSSGTVIATAGAHQSTFGGGTNNYDAFLVKFDPNGVRLWGTYYGGDGNDYGACATDKSGNVFLYGSTTSTAAIITPSAQQTNGGGFMGSGFLAKFNSSGVRQWGTYYGSGSTQAIACATDPSGNIFLAGRTQLTTHTYIASASAHQTTYAGSTDAFLAKFNTSGVRQWGTYYGGAGGDEAFSCATDASGNVYLGGATTSSASGVISTGGSHQTTLNGQWDAMLVKFDGNGTRLWGTYYGGSLSEIFMDLEVDVSGNVYGSGTTNSAGSTVIATPSGYQPAYGGGNNDGFLVKFSQSGVRQHATYYGDSGTDDGYGCALDAGGIVYLCGNTSAASGTALASSGSHQSTSGGLNDGYLAKFDFCDTPPSALIAITPSMVCSHNTPVLQAVAAGAGSYTWTVPSGWSSTNFLPAVTVTPGTAGVFTVVTSNACGVSPQQTFAISVPITPTVSVNSGTICSGKSFTLIPSGAFTYTYSGGPVVSPGVTTTYSVIGTSTAGCVSNNTAVSTVTVYLSPIVSAAGGITCAGHQFSINTVGAATYTFFPSGPVVAPPVTSTFSVTGTSTAGCVSTNTSVVTVVVYALPIIAAAGGTICEGKSFTLNASGGITYTYSGGQVVSPNVTTSYSVTGQGIAGCPGANTAVATVTVFQAPVIQVTTTHTLLCAGHEATLTGGNALSYTFEPGGPGDSQVVTLFENTSYTIQGTDDRGCVGTSVYTQAVDACAGINETDHPGVYLKVFPNPTQGFVTIELDNDREIVIFDMLGHKVYSSMLNAGSHVMDTRGWAKGVYLVKVRAQVGKGGIRLVVE